MRHPFPQSIPEAAKLFDEIKPGWFEEINIDELDMDSYQNCILGQLYGNAEVEDILFQDTPFYSSENPIFGYKVDKNDWIFEIEKRQ